MSLCTVELEEVDISLFFLIFSIKWPGISVQTHLVEVSNHGSLATEVMLN